MCFCGWFLRLGFASQVKKNYLTGQALWGCRMTGHGMDIFFTREI